MRSAGLFSVRRKRKAKDKKSVIMNKAKQAKISLKPIRTLIVKVLGESVSGFRRDIFGE